MLTLNMQICQKNWFYNRRGVEKWLTAKQRDKTDQVFFLKKLTGSKLLIKHTKQHISHSTLLIPLPEEI